MVVMFMYLSSHGTIIYGFLSYHKWFLLTIERSYVILTYHCKNAMSSKKHICSLYDYNNVHPGILYNIQTETSFKISEFAGYKIQNTS